MKIPTAEQAKYLAKLYVSALRFINLIFENACGKEPVVEFPLYKSALVCYYAIMLFK